MQCTIAAAVKNGAELPPLIAEFKEGRLTLADGNHRHGGLSLLQRTSYWTIIWCNSEEELEQLAEVLLPTRP